MTREALVAADQLVVVEVAAVGEEALARLEADVVAPALLVGQPHPLAGAQRAAVDAGPGFGGYVGQGLVLVLGRGHARNPNFSGPRELNARSTSAVASTP